jgi:hypothetical protein
MGGFIASTPHCLSLCNLCALCVSVVSLRSARLKVQEAHTRYATKKDA